MKYKIKKLLGYETPTGESFTKIPVNTTQMLNYTLGKDIGYREGDFVHLPL